MNNNVAEISGCASILVEEFKPDFVKYMIDQSKDMANKLRS